MNYVERLAVIKRDMNAILDVAETEKRGLTPENALLVLLFLKM